MSYARKEVIGSAVLYLGDSAGILPTLADGSMNWCVTSPPYNLHKDVKSATGTDTADAMAAKYDRWYPDELPEPEYQAQQQAVVAELLRVCTDSVFYNHRIRYAWHGRSAEHAPPCKVFHPMQWLAPFPIWCEIIWDRCGTSTPTGRYQQGHELVYQIGQPRTFKRALGMGDVWRIPPSPSDGHVCAFPEKLVENCLSPHAERGESVIDPYMGSGTVAIVAARLGLSFVGIERDPLYFDLACQRLDDSLRQGGLFA